ncbi:TlpA family protein disulfide reductase [Myxococcota bacterium]|nr:TlpA family protein disulfide reductase [Myxococcota bacterium]
MSTLCLLAACASAPPTSPTPRETPVDAARAALAAARGHYRAAGVFRERFDFTLVLPDGREEPRAWQYGAAPGLAFLSLFSDGIETIRVVARDGRVLATQVNAEQRYADGTYDGDFDAALRRIGGESVRIGAPPGVVAIERDSLDAFVDALRFGILEPLEIARFEPASETSKTVNIELVAKNGHVRVGLEADTLRLAEVELVLGTPPEQVRDPRVSTPSMDVSKRTAVKRLDELKAQDYPIGSPAPDLVLETLDGARVRLADLRGSVVVLDLWATWCVPCWTALAHTAELARQTQGSKVRVFAVNTLEGAPSADALRARVRTFLASKGLGELPVLLDVDDAGFRALKSPGLPSLVLIDREGRLAGYHSGVIEDMVATLSAEIARLSRAE